MFTEEQIKEIEQKLKLRSKKDTEFPKAKVPFDGGEELAFIQDNKNVIYDLQDTINELKINGTYLEVIGADANEITERGIYYCIGSKKNFPIGSNDQAFSIFLFVQETSSGTNQYAYIDGVLCTRTVPNSWVTVNADQEIKDIKKTIADLIIKYDDAISGILNTLTLKQDKTDNELATQSKTVVGAINELKTGQDINAENIADNTDEIARIKGDILTIWDSLSKDRQDIDALDRAIQDILITLRKAILSDTIRRMELVKTLPESSSDTIYLICPDLPEPTRGIGSMIIGSTFIVG